MSFVKKFLNDCIHELVTRELPVASYLLQVDTKNTSWSEMRELVHYIASCIILSGVAS